MGKKNRTRTKGVEMSLEEFCAKTPDSLPKPVQPSTQNNVWSQKNVILGDENPSTATKGQVIKPDPVLVEPKEPIEETLIKPPKQLAKLEEVKQEMTKPAAVQKQNSDDDWELAMDTKERQQQKRDARQYKQAPTVTASTAKQKISEQPKKLQKPPAQKPMPLPP